MATTKTPSFSVLPSELICQVFTHAHDFTTVSSLARTSRIFYHTWRENPTTICNAVAPRAVSNFTDAERLLEIQEEAEDMSKEQENHEPKAVTRAKRLLHNARWASAAADEWVSVMEIHHYREHMEGNPHMRPHEIERFKHAFYSVWMIAVMISAPHLKERALAFLDECSPRELYGLDELADWGKSFNNNEFGALGLDLSSEFWKAAYGLIFERWRARSETEGFHAKCSDKRDAPFGFFVFFDHTQYLFYGVPGE